MIIKEEEMNFIRMYRYKRGIGEMQKEGQKDLNAVFIYEIIQIKIKRLSKHLAVSTPIKKRNLNKKLVFLFKSFVSQPLLSLNQQ